MATPPTTGTRPRNRKALIAAAAAKSFAQLGYHRVGMDELAESVGITGGAIYWHFDTKQALLAHLVGESVAVIEEAAAELGTAEHSAAGLDRMLRALAAVSVERREFGVVMQRESGHLADGERGEVRRRLRTVVERTAGAVCELRPGLPASDARFLVRAALSVLASPSSHRVTLPRGRFEDLLHAVTTTVLATTLPRAGEPDGDDPPPASPPAAWAAPQRASRRETLLDASLQLFAERGYQAVTMEDIGAAVGMRGPSVYGHFSSKADLLLAAHVRGAEGLQLGMAGALAGAASPADALHRVLGSYVRFSLEHPHLLRTLLTETVYLPPDDLHRLRRLQHDYVAEWVRLLLAVRPQLSDAEAHVLTHAALGIVNDNSTNPRLRNRPQLHADLDVLGRAVFATPWSAAETISTTGEPEGS